MVRITAFPTIEWLSERGAAPLDVQTVPSGGSGVRRGLEEISTRIEGYLNSWKNGHSIVRTDAWIATPNGEEHVDIVLSQGGRRIGFRLAGPYERDTRQADAVTLVYGRFDAIYRIHYSGASKPAVSKPAVSKPAASKPAASKPAASNPAVSKPAADLVYTILTLHPTWFSAKGRIAAGRLVSSETLLRAQQLHHAGTLHLDGTRLTRIRLSHASDWVEAFESALSAPRLRSFLDEPIAGPTVRPNHSRPFLRESSSSNRKRG